ncbi:hypothetical protein D3C87_852140 [compost metagenome]
MAGTQGGIFTSRQIHVRDVDFQGPPGRQRRTQLLEMPGQLLQYVFPFLWVERHIRELIRFAEMHFGSCPGRAAGQQGQAGNQGARCLLFHDVILSGKMWVAHEPLWIRFTIPPCAAVQSEIHTLLPFPTATLTRPGADFFADSLAILIKTKYCLENIVA